MHSPTTCSSQVTTSTILSRRRIRLATSSLRSSMQSLFYPLLLLSSFLVYLNLIYLNSMGLPNDPESTSLFVNSYGWEFSRDIKPSASWGTSVSLSSLFHLSLYPSLLHNLFLPSLSIFNCPVFNVYLSATFWNHELLGAHGAIANVAGCIFVCSHSFY